MHKCDKRRSLDEGERKRYIEEVIIAFFFYIIVKFFCSTRD